MTSQNTLSHKKQINGKEDYKPKPNMSSYTMENKVSVREWSKLSYKKKKKKKKRLKMNREVEMQKAFYFMIIY